MRRTLRIALLLGLLVLGVGTLLPGRYEVSRQTLFDTSPGPLLARLVELPETPSWSSWTPSRSRGGLEVTAVVPGKGIWLDVAGPRNHKAALLLEAQEGGTRLEWIDVLHLGWNPLGKLLALGRERRVGGQLEESLRALQLEMASRRELPDSPPAQDPLAAERARTGDPGAPEKPGPQVLLILADDLGWGLLERSATPNLDSLARQGMTFTNLWVSPKCGPTRASLLTGRFHFRIGNGEIAKKHANRSLGLEETILPEVIGSERSACYGKWHLGTTLDHPNRCGFGYYAGSLGNLNGKSYTSWPKVSNGVEETCTRYATSDVADEAIRHEADFEFICFHAVHTPFHTPPEELRPRTPVDGTQESQLLAMVEAMDTEVARILEAHPGAWVFFMGDNGTTSLAGGGKGTMAESGINVPLIVRGPGVAQGAQSDALVNVVDLFATIAEIYGAQADTEDSISFLPVLHGEAAARKWNYSCLFYEKKPGRRMHAVRDEEYKLVIDFDREESLFRMPGEESIDLREATPAIQAHVDRLKSLIP